MRGVHVVAAELVARGFIVPVTSRSAADADLLVTDDSFSRAWSVQVEASGNPRRVTCWTLGPKARELTLRTHVYIFANFARPDGSQFYVAPSRVVAKHVRVFLQPNSTWYGCATQERYRDAWRSHVP